MLLSHRIGSLIKGYSNLMKRARLLLFTDMQNAALTVIILFATTIITTPYVFHQQSLAQEQQQLPLSNRTAFNIENPIEDLSFVIENTTFTHNRASVNGILMHYVIGGHGDPVVLLHGWPQTWYEWHEIMPALAKNYTVVAVDLRGLGDTSKSPTGNDGNTRAEDIYQLISQLGFQKIYLVAHDVGVNTAYPFAAYAS